MFWYGSSISIIILLYLSLIRGISSVADGKNVCFKLALKQGFSALVTVISLIYSAVCVAGSCLDLQQPAVEPFLSSTGLLLVFLRGNADLAGLRPRFRVDSFTAFSRRNRVGGACLFKV